MNNEGHRNAFIANHSRLVRKLTSPELIETVFSQGLITVGEKEDIEAERTESSRINKCLSIFHRRYHVDKAIFVKLFEVLKEINIDEGGIIDHVISALNESIRTPVRFPSATGLLSEFERVRLQLYESTIISSVDVSQILPDLISEGVVTIEDGQEIEEEKSATKQGQILVNLLKKRGSEVLKCFIEVLRDSEVYEQLANKLSGGMEEGTDMEDDMYVEKVLKDGHVPPPPHSHIRRKELIKSIRRELRKLRDNDSWVVIHGLPGFGKTVLAADAVHQASLLREVFPGGVFWLNVGRMTEGGSNEVNMDALLEKVQNFILRMDENKYHPPNLESATDYLQTVMTEQHPQCLLILDDLWEAEAAQAFSVRCRTLVTTRYSFVADSVATNNIYKVSVMEGFTEEEGKELLSKYTNQPVSKLPPEANKIIKLSHGSPLVLDIIGASLQKVQTVARWKKAVERLQTQHPGGLPYKGGSSPDLGARRPSEQKRGRMKATLNTSISLTEESLPSDISDYFRSLVVFEEDTVIKMETLATMWGEDEFDAEDIMQTIVSWSLAQQTHNHHSSSDGSPSFTVHDMILDYLNDTVDSEAKTKYHEQLVERYREKCDGRFATLEPDGYIHKRLLFHAHSAGMKDLLVSLLSDLCWLAACVKHWDCNSLLGAYKKYRACLPEERHSVINGFQLFLSGNLDLLSNSPSLSEVVQIALNALYSDELVKQAREVAERDKDTMYFLWNNRAAVQRPEEILKLQPHKNEVKYCQYFDGGSKVASCSSASAKIWVSTTGEILETFNGHSNQITHCAVSEDGQILVTSSDDSTCNVWDTTKRSLLKKFTEHREGVQCCALSSDSKRVVSADISSCVMIWSCEDKNLGQVIGRWNHGDGETGLTSCVFLPSGDEVIVANQEGLIKLYSIKGVVLASFPVVHSTLSHSQSGVLDLSVSRGPSRANSSSSNSGSGFTVRSCVVSRDGLLLAAGVADCTAKVWSIESSEFRHSFPHSSDVLSVDFSPDANLLLTGCLSGTVKVWSLSQNCPILDIPLHYDWVQCVKFSPSGLHLLSSSFTEGIVKVIPVDTSKQSWKLYRRRFCVHFKMALDRSGYTPTILCYDNQDNKLEICEGLNASTVGFIGIKPTLKLRSWCISPDGKLVVVGYDEGVVQLFDLSTGAVKWTVEKAHHGEIPHCYFSPDGRKIVSCGDSQKVWDVDSGKLLSCQPECQDYLVQPCVFYQDSIRLASTKKPGKVLVWNIADGKELFHCHSISDDSNVSILCVNISGDNSKLVASTGNGLVAVWDANTGQKVFNGSYIALSGNSQARFCSLNWNGTLAAVGHDDRTLKIYNLLSGQEKTCPNTSSNSWMISTQFSPDNKQIVTLSNSIQWWSRDGVLLKQFILKSSFGKYLFFSPDFKTFITIDNTGLLYVLSVLTV